MDDFMIDARHNNYRFIFSFIQDYFRKCGNNPPHILTQEFLSHQVTPMITAQVSSRSIFILNTAIAEAKNSRAILFRKQVEAQ
jgi:hypothetical protein